MIKCILFQTMAHEIGHNLGMRHAFYRRDWEQGFNTKCYSEGTGAIKLCDQCVNWDPKQKMSSEQTDSSGECCTGFMDYGRRDGPNLWTSPPQVWSDCSVKVFEATYRVKKWASCMPEKGTTYCIWLVNKVEIHF